MTIPDDLALEIRNGRIRLSSNGRTAEYDYTPTRSGVGVFVDGPVKWSDLITRYVEPALYQLTRPDAL